MTKISLILVVTATSILISSACASVSTVQRDAQGGTIAIKGTGRKAVSRAQEAMYQHCGGPYVIVEEKRVKVGERTDHESTKDYGEREQGGSHEARSPSGRHEREEWDRELQGYEDGASSTEKSEVYEQWLTYRCGTA